MFKPRLWSRRKYFFTPPFQSFPIPTPQDLIMRLLTSALVQKESNFTLKYAIMATPTQRHSYKQGCGVGVPESHVLERSRSTFLDLIKLELQLGVGFLDSMELEIGVLIAFGDFDLRKISLHFHLSPYSSF